MKMDPYNRIVVANTELDCQMSVLQGKIKAKKSDIEKLRLKLDNESGAIKKLEEEIKESVEREENIKKTIDGFRNSKSMNEALATNLKHQLNITQEENQNNINFRNGIIKEFSDKAESYSSVLRSLPEVKEMKSKEIEIKKEQIELAKLKQMYCDYQRNVHLLHKIGKQKMNIAITNFARLMVERRREMNTMETVEANNNKLEREIQELENQKNSLSHNASERPMNFVKRETFVSPHLPSSSFKQSARKAQVIVSIRERLGISHKGPLEVKSDKQEPKAHHKMVTIPEDQILSSDVCEEQANKPKLNKNSQKNSIPSKSLQIIPERRQIPPRRVTFKQKSTEDQGQEYVITKHRKISTAEVAKAEENVITKHRKISTAEVAKDSVLSKPPSTDESIQKMNARPTNSDDLTPAVEQNIFSPPFNKHMSLSQPTQKPSNMDPSMYEFAPIAPSPGVMTLPFSSSSSQPLGQDYFSLFGGASTSQKKSSTSSFFNLF